MNKNKVEDFLPHTDQEAANYIKEHLSSNKKLISQNYTKQNFKYFKRNFPQLWNYVKGRKIIIQNKQFDFSQRVVQPLYINGKQYKDNYSISNGTNTIQILRKYDFTNFNLKTFFEFCLNNFKSGFRPILIIKNYYPELLKELQIYQKDSDNEREVVYRYLNGLKQKPKINNIPLKFHCHTIGYQSQALYEQWLKLDNKNDEHEILKIFIQKLKYEKKTSIQLKHFFSQLDNKIDKKYSNYKYFNTKCWLYYNNLDKLPKCKICGKEVKEYNHFSYYDLCSMECMLKDRQYNKRIGAINRIKEYQKWKLDYGKYLEVCDLLTKYSYMFFKHIINPNNLRRGNYSYHIDHIIPKQYGFKHQIQPMIICHYKNLQMLWWKKNEIKSNKLFYNATQINDILNDINNSLKNDNYYEREVEND